MRRSTLYRTLITKRSTIKNEYGVIFPYVLTLMILSSSFILMNWKENQEELNHIQLLDKQETIQNLIQISLFEFQTVLRELELSQEKQELVFNYSTGNVDVIYYLLSDNSIRIELEVDINDPNHKPYKHTLVWNV